MKSAQTFELPEDDIGQKYMRILVVILHTSDQISTCVTSNVLFDQK